VARRRPRRERRLEHGAGVRVVLESGEHGHDGSRS
jgi:hypothetical protein